MLLAGPAQGAMLTSWAPARFFWGGGHIQNTGQNY